MELVSSFRRQLQRLAVRMSARLCESFVVPITGWIFAAPRTVTSMIVAAGVQQRKHRFCFHRFFANVSWSLAALGLTAFSLIEPWIEGTIFLAIDDTLAAKAGVEDLRCRHARRSPTFDRQNGAVEVGASLGRVGCAGAVSFSPRSSSRPAALLPLPLWHAVSLRSCNTTEITDR